MKIAIIGNGIIGLSCAWQFSSFASQITLFYSPYSKAASEVAAGLVHPLVGMKANCAPHGWEALEHARKMVAAICPDDSPIVQEGIFRPATTPEMVHYFRKAADLHPEKVFWMDSCDYFSNTMNRPGIYIPSGFALSSKKYLETIRKKLLTSRAQNIDILERHITSYSELQGYDRILIAAGAGAPELTHLPQLRINKGQLLQYRTDVTSLHALSGRAYAVFEKGCCTVGSTYEHFPQNHEADIETAQKIILPKVREFLPEIDEATLIGAEAGYRCATADSMPIIQQLAPHVWTIAGLGSKGFLYHAYLPKMLQQAFFSTSGA